MNKYKITGVFFVWLVFGLLHTLVLSQYIDLNTGVLLVHSLSRAVIFFFLTLMLNAVVVFGRFSALSIIQKTLNYLFLAILTVGIWVGMGYLLDWLFFENPTDLKNLVGLYVAVGFLLYVIVLQFIIIQRYRFDGFMQGVAEHTSTTLSNHTSTALSNHTSTALSNHTSTTLSNRARNDEPEKTEILERIAVKSNSKIHVLPVSDIYLLASDGDYVMIHTENAKYLKEQTMKYFETRLPDNFLRIHRSYIVNSEKISRVELLEKQTYYLILKNNQRIKMSVGGYRVLRQKLGL